MAKRAQNEGTIYKRADGRWEGAITLPGTGGKRKRFYGDTQREVREKLTALHHDLNQGLPVVTERQTVAQFLDAWLADVVKSTVRPKTYESYTQVVRLYLAPSLGRHQLAKLEPQHVQAMMNAMGARAEEDGGPLSPRTVQYARAVLRRALGKALKWGKVARNVATLVDPPPVDRHEMRAFDPAEARRFLDAVRGDRLEALYAVALSLGLRQGEALGLRWQDVDLDAGLLHVRVALQRLKGQGPRLAEPKTRQSRRTLPLPAPLIAQLRAHRKRQLEDRLLAGGRWVGDTWGLVFANRTGGPLDPTHVVKAFKGHLRRADLPEIRFHDLRHACASLLVAQGTHPREVMEILGHSTITLTMNTYSHVMPQAKRTALDALAGALAVAGD